MRRHNRDIFSIFLNINVCCVFALESPHRGDSNEYTQYTIFNIKKKITINYPKSAAMGFCSKGLKKEFERALVYEPSLFKPLKIVHTYVRDRPYIPSVVLWDKNLSLLCHIEISWTRRQTA